MTIAQFTAKISGRLSVTYKQPEPPAATPSALAATQDNRPAEVKKPWCAGFDKTHWMDCGYGDTQEEALDNLVAKILSEKRVSVTNRKNMLAEAEAELAALEASVGVDVGHDPR